MGLNKKKGLSKGWVRSDIGFNLVYIKAYKRNIFGTVVKYGGSASYTFMLKNEYGKILGFGKDFNTLFAASRCDDLYKSLSTKEF